MVEGHKLEQTTSEEQLQRAGGQGWYQKTATVKRQKKLRPPENPQAAGTKR